VRIELAMLALVSLPVAAQVSPVAFSESKDTVPAFGPSGPIMLPAARLQIDVTYPHGKKERIETTVLYDPQTGHYLWHLMAPVHNVDDTGRYIQAIKSQKSLAFADTSGLMDFIYPSGLFAKAWRGSADSLDDAVSATLTEIQQGVPAHEASLWHMDYKFLPVFGLVRNVDAQLPAGYEPIDGGAFMCSPLQQFCPPGTTVIASITKQGRNYRLLIRNRFDVEVILDHNLDLVSAKQLTQPPATQGLERPRAK